MRISDWSSDVCSSDLNGSRNNGRHDDNGFDGMQLIADIRLIYDNYAFDTEILVASVRHGIHVLEAAKIGADVITAPRSAARRVGQECVSTCSTRWSPYP